MIKKYYITGDAHGDFSRFKNLPKEVQQDPEVAIIILGDAGLNWTLDEHDAQIKNMLSKKYAFTIYCVRGNHEARPSDVHDMLLEYDHDVGAHVWQQKKWPRIKYFKDFGIYHFGNYRTAVIGGAYSVDKWYRLERGYRWFENEQLSPDEMRDCKFYFNTAISNKFDFVLTHTCPISWEPRDLFLASIDQSKVDKSTEIFLEEMKDELDWSVWLFGHHHDDRLVRPHVEMFYNDIDKLDDIMENWQKYDKTGQVDWWLKKDPWFYTEEKKKN